MKFEIKSWVAGGVLFSIETDSWRLAVEAAVKSGTDLSSADLRSADLSSADLRFANLSSANLRSANLRSANLRSANLRSADLRSADLRFADLRFADLRFANLSSANLRSANLSSADLSSADLRSADLREIKDADLVLAQTSIVPADGPIHGWKKCRNGVLVKVAVGSKAKRSNASGRKCRAEYVKVLEVIGADEGISMYDGETKYQVGKIVRCGTWDDIRWNECSGGIHFFLTRQEAEAWEG